MKLTMPTLAQSAAFGRHVVSYSMGAITAAAAVHAIDGGQASSLTGAVSQIASGVTSIAGGIATIVSVGAGLYAAWSASPLRQLLAAAANPNVQKVIAPAIADSVPSDKVVAK